MTMECSSDTTSNSSRDEEVERAIAAAKCVSKLNLTSQSVVSMSTEDQQRRLVQKHMESSSSSSSSGLQCVLPSLDDPKSSWQRGGGGGGNYENPPQGNTMDRGGNSSSSSSRSANERRGDVDIARSEDRMKLSGDVCSRRVQPEEEGTAAFSGLKSANHRMSEHLNTISAELNWTKEQAVKVKLLLDAVETSSDLLMEARDLHSYMELYGLSFLVLSMYIYVGGFESVPSPVLVLALVLCGMLAVYRFKWASWQKKRRDHVAGLKQQLQHGAEGEGQDQPPCCDASESTSISESTRDDAAEDCDWSHGKAAEDLFDEDKILAAGRTLQGLMDDGFTLSPRQGQMLRFANECEHAMQLAVSEPREELGWKEVKSSILPENSRMHQQVKPGSPFVLVVRVESVMDRSLVPFVFCTLFESQLWTTWLPQFTFPFKIGFSAVETLKDSGRSSKMILASLDHPWPMSMREIAVKLTMIEDVDNESNPAMICKLNSLNTGDGGGIVPPPSGSGTVRIGVDGSVVLRPCPKDRSVVGHNDGVVDDKVLLTYFLELNTNVPTPPQAFADFIAGTVLAVKWSKVMNTAQEVQEGNRPLHVEAMKEKWGTVYNWFQSKLDALASSRTCT